MEKKRQGSIRGKLAEDYAIRLLSKKGYKIIGRNFRGKFGEIDIITIKNDCLVFVEVKARWSNNFGKPEEAVTAVKLSKIYRTAEYFAALNPGLPHKLRVDVVALEIDGRTVSSAKIINVD